MADRKKPAAKTKPKKKTAPKPVIDARLMAVLSRRLEAIIREMSNTVMKASRSAAITIASDM